MNSRVDRTRHATAAPDATIPADEWSQWFEGMNFTADWLSKDLPQWLVHLAEFRDRPVKVLEVGSWEGRSAVAFLRLLPSSHLTCIDIFVVPGTEERFDANLARFEGRIEKIKDCAAAALDRLYHRREVYDVIYLDAAKKRDEAFAQSALAWPLLKEGGVLIWDDLKWRCKPSNLLAWPDLNWEEDPGANAPGDGIRLFCRTFADSLEVLLAKRQMIVRKTRAWPIQPLYPGQETPIP